jgi:hypothetical protein
MRSGIGTERNGRSSVPPQLPPSRTLSPCLLGVPSIPVPSCPCCGASPGVVRPSRPSLPPCSLFLSLASVCFCLWVVAQRRDQQTRQKPRQSRRAGEGDRSSRVPTPPSQHQLEPCALLLRRFQKNSRCVAKSKIERGVWAADKGERKMEREEGGVRSADAGFRERAPAERQAARRGREEEKRDRAESKETGRTRRDDRRERQQQQRARA